MVVGVVVVVVVLLMLCVHTPEPSAWCAWYVTAVVWFTYSYV